MTHSCKTAVSPRDFLPSELTEGVEKEFQTLVPKYYEAGQNSARATAACPASTLNSRSTARPRSTRKTGPRRLSTLYRRGC